MRYTRTVPKGKPKSKFKTTSLTFTAEDLAIVGELSRHMAEKQGPVTVTQVIRTAIRKLAEHEGLRAA